MQKIKIECIYCKKENEISVAQRDWNRWLEGKEYIQNVFPYLSEGERELIMTNVCGDCFDNIFEECEEW